MRTLLVALASLTVALPALAQDAAPVRPPYSLPWYLRSAAAVNVVKSDTSIGFADPGTAITTSLTGGYRLVPDVALALRVAWSSFSPETGSSGTGLANPLVSGSYTPWLTDELRLAVSAGATVPIGQGGGNDPDPATRTAATIGLRNRVAMENALFAVNYLTLFAGADVAYFISGLTLQAEATFFQLLRVRGDVIDMDSARTNGTVGLHVGYQLFPGWFASGEVHLQRWLSTPSFIDAVPAAREQGSFTLGVRGLIRAGSVLIRPGVSFSMPIDDPMANEGWKIIQVDVPVIF